MPQQDTAAVCVERVAAGGPYLGMAAHPDGGSSRAFVYSQKGEIWLATVPTRGAGAAMELVPFVHLTDTALVLMGLAVHPGFATNGRLIYVSYACDRTISPACGGAGTSSPAGNGSTSWPWRYQLVVEEFTAKGVDYAIVAKVCIGTLVLCTDLKAIAISFNIKMCVLLLSVSCSSVVDGSIDLLPFSCRRG